jgi:uncharacterized protein YukE
VADEVRVDPAILDAGSGVCDDLRDDVRRGGAGVEDATADAARGLAGWYCRGSLETLAWSWHDDLARLGGFLDRFGAALRKAAGAYRHADHASAGDFRAVDR